jgi:hypothetical protein
MRAKGQAAPQRLALPGTRAIQELALKTYANVDIAGRAT